MAAGVMGRPKVRPLNRTRERMFFGGMSLLMIACVLLGFRMTYFPLGAKPVALSSWVIVIHGAVFSLYLLLFLVQTALVSARKVHWHRQLGLWIYGLACIMVPLGIFTAMDELRRKAGAGPPWEFVYDPWTFSLVSVMGISMFGALIAASYIARRKPDVHKRLALYATLAMMDAATDRWPWEAWGVNHIDAWQQWTYASLMLLPVVYDLISLHRIHRATLVAAPFAITLHRLEIPLGLTPAWHTVSNLMLKFWH